MKRLFALVLVLMLACLCVTAINAEEATTVPETTENATTEANAPTGDENAPVEEWGNTVTTTEYFDSVVMPLIVGLGSGGVITIGALLCVLKMWGRLKDAVSKGRELLKSNKASEEEITHLKDLLAKIDVNTIKSELDACVEDAKAALKLDEKTLAEMAGTLESLKAMQENFMKAAENAWSASPAAVSLLTSAESTAIKSMAAKITSFEKYIRAEKGAEAEDIIHNIEGV